MPARGDQVYFMSGRRLGVVSEVREDAFQVHTGDGATWLTRDAVFTVAPGRVTLVCERDGLDNYAWRELK